MRRLFRLDVVLLALSFVAQLTRDLILISLLGLGSALDVIKASTAILIYLFTTLAGAAANAFLAQSQQGDAKLKAGDFFVVYAGFALAAQFLLFEYVIAPGFAPEKMAEAKAFALVALLASLLIAPYAMSRFLNIRDGRLSLVASQQLLTSALYIALFLALLAVLPNTAAGVLALCAGILVYAAVSLRSAAIDWGRLDWSVTASGLGLWVALFSSQALQSSSRFIDRAFASHIGDGYFALIDLVYVALAGATVFPLGVFNIYVAPRLAGLPQFFVWAKRVLIGVSLCCLAIAAAAGLYTGSTPTYQLSAVKISLLDVVLALVAIAAYLPNAIAFNAMIVTGQSRAAFVIVALRTAAKIAFLGLAPSLNLFLVLASIVVAEALASLAFAAVLRPPANGGGSGQSLPAPSAG